MTAIFLAFRFGYKGLILLVVSILVAVVIFFLSIGVVSYIWPPKVRQSLRNGDSGLRLTDRPPR